MWLNITLVRFDRSPHATGCHFAAGLTNLKQNCRGEGLYINQLLLMQKYQIFRAFQDCPEYIFALPFRLLRASGGIQKQALVGKFSGNKRFVRLFWKPDGLPHDNFLVAGKIKPLCQGGFVNHCTNHNSKFFPRAIEIDVLGNKRGIGAAQQCFVFG